MSNPVVIRDGDQACASVYPELGDWVVRYARNVPLLGSIDALHHDYAADALQPGPDVGG